MNFKVRKATLIDLAQVLDLMNELALNTYNIKISLNIYDLIRDGFSKEKYFGMFIAEYKDKIIGFTLFYDSYSIYGKSLVIEEAFVTSEYEKYGVALALFSKCLEYANNKDIVQMEWLYHERFPSLKELYERAGAIVLMDLGIYSISKNDLDNYIPYKNYQTHNYNNVVIREGTMADMPSVLSLINEVCNIYNTKPNLTINSLIDDGYAKNFFKTIVLELDEKVIGFILFYEAYAIENGKALNIGVTYIYKKYRHSGLGKELIDYLIQYAKKHKYNKISQLIPDNDEFSIQRANDFYAYRKEGIRVTRITKEALSNFINK